VVRVGLPPAIVSGLCSEVSYIVTLVAPTCDHESISCPQYGLHQERRDLRMGGNDGINMVYTGC
jgi:hypothetical protein